MATSKITFSADSNYGSKYENQDKFFAVKTETGGAYMGVFDGHGEFGTRVAEEAAYTLRHAGPAAAAGAAVDDEDAEDPFEAAHSIAKAAIIGAARRKYGLCGDYRQEDDGRLTRTGMWGQRETLRGGTTATVVSVEDNLVRVAHVGDSDVLVVHESGYFKILTKDHSTNSLEEYKRMLKKVGPKLRVEFDAIPGSGVTEPRPVFITNPEDGSVVANPAGGFYYSNVSKDWASYLVNNKDPSDRLNMTRALGDYSLRHLGLSCTPDLAVEEICGEGRTWVIAASDGLFDSFTPEQLRDVVLKQAAHDGSAAAMQAHLMKTGLETGMRLFGRGAMDNITICVALVEPPSLVRAKLQLDFGTLGCAFRHGAALKLVVESRHRGLGLTLDLRAGGQLTNKTVLTLGAAERLVRGEL